MRNAWTHKLAAVAIVALIGSALGAAGAAAADPPIALIVRSVDGSDNNPQHPTWGKAGLAYRRVAPANYADGRSTQVAPAKPDRYISNRVFNDLGQNLFSENNISQWGWLWGQFLDHDLGPPRRDAGETSPVPFNQADPLERSERPRLDRVQPDARGARHRRHDHAPTAEHPQSATSTRRRCTAWTGARATWLRDRRHAAAAERLPARVDARGNPATAPAMDHIGQLAGDARRRGCRRRRTGEREHRPHGHPDAVRPRAQSHREIAAEVVR